MAAVLEFLDESNGLMIDVILPQCLPYLDNLTNFVSKYSPGQDGQTSYRYLLDIEEFMTKVTCKLLNIACKFPEHRSSLVPYIFAWIFAFLKVMGDAKATICAQAAVIGIFKGITTQNGFAFEKFDHNLCEILELLFTRIEIITIVVRAPDDGFNDLGLFNSAFAAICVIASSLLFIVDHTFLTCIQDVWDELLQSRSIYDTVEYLPTTLKFVNRMTDYGIWLDFISDDIQGNNLLENITVRHYLTQKARVLIALIIPSLYSITLDGLKSTIFAVSPLPESCQLDSFLNSVEGICILTLQSDMPVALSVNTLTSFLVSPATIFFSIDPKSSIILRQCAVQSLTNILKVKVTHVARRKRNSQPIDVIFVYQFSSCCLSKNFCWGRQYFNREAPYEFYRLNCSNLYCNDLKGCH